MRRHRLAAASLLVVALFLPPPLSAEEFCPPLCPSGTITLGFAGPLTGPSAAFGLQTAKSAQIGVDKLNATGGISGFPIKLSLGDDRCDRGQAVEVANRHVLNEKLAFVIGPACPAAALTASQIYAKAGVVQFVPTATTVDLTRQGFDGVFRMLTTVEQEAQEQFGVELIGQAETLKTRCYAISVQRKLKHPAGAAIAQAAREKVFAEKVTSGSGGDK